MVVSFDIFELAKALDGLAKRLACESTPKWSSVFGMKRWHLRYNDDTKMVTLTDPFRAFTRYEVGYEKLQNLPTGVQAEFMAQWRTTQTGEAFIELSDEHLQLILD